MRCALIVILVLGNFALASPPSPEEILQQKRPESWPEWVDVKMDASILTDETLKQEFKECFSQAPSLMLELSEEDLFGENGIYPKEADSKMERTEALVKATYWHPKKEGFSINCGIRLQGSGSLSQSSKRNFRLRFAKKFGHKALKYTLFKNDKAEEFENLLIRNPQILEMENCCREVRLSNFCEMNLRIRLKHLKNFIPILMFPPSLTTYFAKFTKGKEIGPCGIIF